MEKIWFEVIRIYTLNPEAWWVLGALIVFAGLLSLYPNKDMGWALSNPKGRGKMLRKKRREFVEQQAVDDFVHSVEERWFNGAYSDEEKKELYRRFKLVFPTIRDLFPSSELLKENIRHRHEAKVNKPVPLPGVLPELSKKRRHMFDKPVTD